MSGRPPVSLGFAFEPVPQRARALRRTRIINEQQFDLCAFIYGRADWDRLARRQPTPTLTMKQLIEGVAWTKTDGGLGHHLRRLREVGLLSWVVQGRDLYVFTLTPDSENAESSSAVGTQRPRAAQSSSHSTDTNFQGDQRSEVEAKRTTSGAQSSGRLTERSATSANAGGERGSGSIDDLSAESSSEVQNLQHLGDDEWTIAHARETRTRSSTREDDRDPGVESDVIAFVNGARSARGDEPLTTAPSFHDPLSPADQEWYDNLVFGEGPP